MFFILKLAQTTKYLNPVRRGCASTVPVEEKIWDFNGFHGFYLVHI
jgi:hypothetical protein